MGTSAGSANADQLLYFPVQGVTKSGLRTSGKVLITLNEEQITLIPYRDQVHAIQEKCPHQGGPLHLGEIEDLPNKESCIKCPWHSWQFSITTGECVVPGNLPAKKLKIYPVLVEGDTLKIGFPQIAKKFFKATP